MLRNTVFNDKVCFSTGVRSQQLTQPASVVVQPGESLTINCQVSYSVSGYWTGWIRQPAGKGLEWIGVARAGSTTYYKDSLRNKFSISTDSSSNTDSAVYYCAKDTMTHINRGSLQ
uniref:Ig-like domain-containing protein n=1 Tax=Salarias fasciatus TaxID=181472 RepID=A0A672F3Z5_SALFA